MENSTRAFAHPFPPENSGIRYHALVQYNCENCGPTPYLYTCAPNQPVRFGPDASQDKICENCGESKRFNIIRYTDLTAPIRPDSLLEPPSASRL